jgi:hypothetical protein
MRSQTTSHPPHLACERACVCHSARVWCVECGVWSVECGVWTPPSVEAGPVLHQLHWLGRLHSSGTTRSSSASLAVHMVHMAHVVG